MMYASGEYSEMVSLNDKKLSTPHFTGSEFAKKLRKKNLNRHIPQQFPTALPSSISAPYSSKSDATWILIAEHMFSPLAGHVGAGSSSSSMHG